MKKSLLFTLYIASHVAFMVIVPLFIFGGIGLLVDRSLNTLPANLFIGIGIAFIVTMIWIKKQLKRLTQFAQKEL